MIFFQLEEDERRLSKLSIRDEEVGLESDEEETGMIFKETILTYLRPQDYKRQQKTTKQQQKTTKKAKFVQQKITKK